MQLPGPQPGRRPPLPALGAKDKSVLAAGRGDGPPWAHSLRSWWFPGESPSPKAARAQAVFLLAEVAVPLWPPLSRQHDGGTEQSDLPSSGPSVGGPVGAAWPPGTRRRRPSGLRALDGGTAFRVTAFISVWIVTRLGLESVQPL